MVTVQIIPVLLLLFTCFVQIQSLTLHSFYALENTDVVSSSQSIQAMNKCKDECLTMGKFYPFKFKYHRYVLRQSTGRNKYFQGTCLFAMKDDESTWYGWDELKVFISDTTMQVNLSEMQRWSDFHDRCEDPSLKMDAETLKSLQFERVHSNFEYYDNGTFTNLEPFTDLNEMLQGVSGYLG